MGVVDMKEFKTSMSIPLAIRYAFVTRSYSWMDLQSMFSSLIHNQKINKLGKKLITHHNPLVQLVNCFNARFSKMIEFWADYQCGHWIGVKWKMKLANKNKKWM